MVVKGFERTLLVQLKSPKRQLASSKLDNIYRKRSSKMPLWAELHAKTISDILYLTFAELRNSPVIQQKEFPRSSPNVADLWNTFMGKSLQFRTISCYIFFKNAD